MIFSDSLMIDYSLKLSPEQVPTVWQIPQFEHFRQLAANWLLLSQKVLILPLLAKEILKTALLGIKQCALILSTPRN